jgi:hypothetical protein
VEEVASQLILITAGYEITNASHILEVQVMNLVHDSQLTLQVLGHQLACAHTHNHENTWGALTKTSS